MARNPFHPYKVTPATLRRNPAGFQPRFKDSQRLQEVVRRIERLDQDLHHYEATSEATRRLLRASLARNAYGTASIEGNPLTLQDVESLLAKAPKPSDVEADEREILNWTAFMERLPATFPGTVQEVLDLHARLFEGVMDDAGQLKVHQNFIGDKAGHVVFIPSAPRAVPRELQAALDWLHEAPLHPLVRAAIFFHEFQGIHPFHDGNGRTGRALFTWFLNEQGYQGIRYAPVDYAFNADRDPYYSTLAEVEESYEYTPWVEYLLGVLVRAYEDAVRTFQIRQENPNLPERQAAIVEHFVRLQSWNKKRRLKFNDIHAAFPHIPRRSLQRDLAGLVSAGILDRKGELKTTNYGLP
jgi:Fic family protein